MLALIASSGRFHCRTTDSRAVPLSDNRQTGGSIVGQQTDVMSWNEQLLRVFASDPPSYLSIELIDAAENG